jgi:hypothetical protein
MNRPKIMYRPIATKISPKSIGTMSPALPLLSADDTTRASQKIAKPPHRRLNGTR